MALRGSVYSTSRDPSALSGASTAPTSAVCSRDGTLVVVSKDLTRCSDAGHVAKTLQSALDDWAHAAPRLAELATLDDAAFRSRFSGSPIKRIGRARFLRNVAYAIGNSGEKALLAALEPLLSDPDPVLADAARWAVGQLRN